MPGLRSGTYDAQEDGGRASAGMSTINTTSAKSSVTKVLNLLEPVLTPRKGRGMIAAQDIKRGTRIISEAPILTIDKNDDKRLLQKFLRLSRAQHDQLTELCGDKKHTSLGVYETFAHELEKSHQYSGKFLAAAARDLAKMHTIFFTNAVMMGPDACHGIGVFPTYSRLNHSCTPNVQNSYNATIGRETVHAIRDIEKGEEVVTAYVPIQRPAHLRNDDFVKKWGHECFCETCLAHDQLIHETRRQRLYEIDQGFALLQKDADQRTYAWAFSSGMVPKSDGEALQWAVEGVQLLELEGLVGMDLARTYRECSQYSLREGCLETGLAYARKELEIQVTCLGEDTAYMAPDEDANAWIHYIQNMSDADQTRMRMNDKRAKKEQKRMDKKAAKKALKR